MTQHCKNKFMIIASYSYTPWLQTSCGYERLLVREVDRFVRRGGGGWDVVKCVYVYANTSTSTRESLCRAHVT